MYVEVKGYQVERDIHKWDTVKNKLYIIKNNEIQKLDKLLLEDINIWD